METIRQKLRNNEVGDAIRLLDQCLLENPRSDEALYLRGNAYRKLGNFQLALNDYLAAIELNPDSPARQAHDMLMDIMNFYYKEMYNQ